MTKEQRYIFMVGSQIVALPVALLLGGFIFGFVVAKDLHSGFLGFLERFPIGFIYAYLSIHTMGFPWKDEGGTASYNIWPLVAPLSFAIGVLIYLLISLLARTLKKPIQPPETTRGK